MANEHDWPDHLDALKAAPEHHTLLFENETVRVLDTRVPAGHKVPLHTHSYPSVLYFVSWSHCVRRDAQGKVVMDSREHPETPIESAHWSAPMPAHTLENIGESELRTINIELKKPE